MDSVIRDILTILVPALLIVGGGAFQYWRFMQRTEADKKKDQSDYQLKADQAAWQRVNEVMAEQAETNIERKREIVTLKQEIAQLKTEIKYLEELLNEQ